MNTSIVYFTKNISGKSILDIFKSLNKKLKKEIAIKISTGEPGGNNYLHPDMLEDICKYTKGTIIECCTAYGGKRQDPADHWKCIEDHGFKTIAPVDLMDEFGEIKIPIKNGFHLKEDIVGEHLNNYNSIIVLSHFKGHVMAGFGGALKNISIGIASTHGKALIHSAGKTISSSECRKIDVKQDDFLESMADASLAVINHVGRENMVYINVAYRLSVDCDCDSHPAEPEMNDIGIFASLDPVAIDQACYDAVINSDDEGKKSLIERMNSRHGIRTIEAAYELGLGNREYKIVNIDQ